MCRRSEISCAGGSDRNDIESPKAISLEATHEEATGTVISDHLALIPDMDDGNVLFGKPTDRDQIASKMRHIQHILKFERLDYSVDSSIYKDITNTTHVQKVIIGNRDAPNFVSNWMKISEPLALVRHMSRQNQLSRKNLRH